MMLHQLFPSHSAADYLAVYLHLLIPRSPASRHFHTAEELHTLKLEAAENISVSKKHKPNLFFDVLKDVVASFFIYFGFVVPLQEG